MLTEKVISYLQGIPPFQFLDEETLKSLASSISIEFFPKDIMILGQDGPPSKALRIIKKGGVKIFLLNGDEEVVIDYKSEGDVFGYLSLISRDKSRTNVMAVEDTLCYVIPRDVVLKTISIEPIFGEYFMKSFFKNYMDKTCNEMRRNNNLFREGEKVLYTTAVKDLITRTAETTDRDTSIRDAAMIMSKHKISSLVITDKSSYPEGIITDKDLRDKVVALEFSTSRPVSDIMSGPLVTITSKDTCFDALSVMIRHNIHHLLVTEKGELKGVITNHDFMLIQGTSPLSILKNIDQQSSIEELGPIRDRIFKTLSILLKEGIKAASVIRIITELHDRLIRKIIDLSMPETGPVPSTFSFFVYGSEGRMEQTFKSVFRCAIVYEDKNIQTPKKTMDRFCAILLEKLRVNFEKCGMPLFDSHPLGNSMEIYGDISQWTDNIILALRSEHSHQVLNARKLLDARTIYGDISIVEKLKARVFSAIRKSSGACSLMTEYTEKPKSPIGFFKRFVVDESGEQNETLDLKKKALVPIIEPIRSLCIAHNIHETPTIIRLSILARKGYLKNQLKNDVVSAYEFLLHILLQAQLNKKESGNDIDNLIYTENLTLLEKKSLKEVFLLIPALQNCVKGLVPRQEATA
ncbi:MAG: CBS domain-containing protein [Nitrospira sp.]|nr:CBS domain-containing protein [bacterium]MBL7048172.1 CBS domain-containing protein [Nitrospira sp.]